MCGIAVIVAPKAERLRPQMMEMLQKLEHRGPDGTGMACMNNCILGHTRLSIIDIAGGAQPMFDAGKSRAVVFNGELYDYRTQKKSYASYPFHTESDTELLLAVHDRHGLDMCANLRGMFAFALWDEQAQRLICGRDRFGEKPLYYACNERGEFIAASEIKAILASGLVSTNLSRQALSAYLRMGYIPEGMGIFREIRQLPPGHLLVFENGSAICKPWWEMPRIISNAPDWPDACSEFLRLLNQSVGRCLVADVEVGLLLSGGLDSTSVAALAAGQADIRAFSFGMAGTRNELPYARAAAAQYGLPLEESYVDDLDFPHFLQSLPVIYDEPLADTSCLPTLMLCGHIARHVKAAIGGDGGDELLGGYSWYAGLDEAAQGITEVSGAWSRHAAAHFQRRSFCSTEVLREAGLPPWYPELPPELGGSVDDALRMDLSGFLPADILKKTDRASMHYGLELRSPFLDCDLANFLLSLPPSFKIVSGGTKLLLRKTFATRWPKAISNRPKQGFGMDCGAILARPDVREMANDYLHGPNMAIRSILPGQWLDKHTANNSKFAWCLLVLSLWCEHVHSHGWMHV